MRNGYGCDVREQGGSAVGLVATERLWNRILGVGENRRTHRRSELDATRGWKGPAIVCELEDDPIANRVGPQERLRGLVFDGLIAHCSERECSWQVALVARESTLKFRKLPSLNGAERRPTPIRSYHEGGIWRSRYHAARHQRGRVAQAGHARPAGGQAPAVGASVAAVGPDVKVTRGSFGTMEGKARSCFPRPFRQHRGRSASQAVSAGHGHLALGIPRRSSGQPLSGVVARRT